MSVSKARSHVTNRVNKGGGDATAESAQDARRVLAEEKIKARVEAVVAASPPLSETAKLRLAALLRRDVL